MSLRNQPAQPSDPQVSSVPFPPVSSSRSRLKSRFGYLALAVLGVALLSGCDVEDKLRFGWPRGITPQADRMQTLWVWSVVAALVVGVLVWGLIFWVVVRYRKRKHDDELPEQTNYNLPIEILYTIVPLLIVVVLFYYTVVVQNYVGHERKNPDVTIDVVAFKWNWEFQYPGVKESDGDVVSTVGSSDEIPILVLPANKTIRFQQTARDVIHSFWVPKLLFKRDAIPGRTTSFEVTVTKEGAYVGRCAELCGTYHSMMNFEMRVVNWEDYLRFLDEKQNGESTANALRSIGQSPYATTTKPYDSKRTADSQVK